MKIYLLYRSSKGGKDLLGVFTDKQEAIVRAIEGTRWYYRGTTFRVYEADEGIILVFDKLPIVFQRKVY